MTNDITFLAIVNGLPVVVRDATTSKRPLDPRVILPKSGVGYPFFSHVSEGDPAPEPANGSLTTESPRSASSPADL